MIPVFDDRGYLPPGIHPATIDEFGKRFGIQSEIRQSQFESLCWIIDMARKPQYELQISVTRNKLSELKKCFESVSQETEGDEIVCSLTLRALKKAVKQFTEDLVRLEAHAHNAMNDL